MDLKSCLFKELFIRKIAIVVKWLFREANVRMDEDDFSAAIRESQEEVGINLDDPSQYAYLGKFPKTFFAYKTPKGGLFIAVHMFFQLDLR